MGIRDFFKKGNKAERGKTPAQSMVEEIMKMSYGTDFEYVKGIWRVPSNPEEMWGRLNILSPDTLASILKASKHPDFEFDNFYHWFRFRGLQIKEASRCYGILSTTAVDPREYPRVTSLAYNIITGSLDYWIDVDPEYVTAVLLLSAELFHDMPSIIGNEDDYLCEPLRLQLQKTPERAHEIFDFMKRRGLTHLSDIDPSAFHEASSSASASLSGGAL